MKKKIALVIPTYNPEEEFERVLELVSKQSEWLDEIKIIDSSSTNRVLENLDLTSVSLEIIPKSEFSHAGTRTKMAKEFFYKNYNYIIFMSQDVFIQKDAIKELISFIKSDNSLGVVFGKQDVDLAKGNIFEKNARDFNYPKTSYTRSASDIEYYGIKTIFSSDAFAIYDLEKLMSVNYFGYSSDVSEDMFVAHKLIQNDFKVGYCATAKVYHTHNYNLREEYARYKKIGEFYGNNADLVNMYGKTNSQGIGLVFNEIFFLVRNWKIHLIPYSVIRNLVKFVGHKRGITLAKK